jgi:uncharacterized protein
MARDVRPFPMAPRKAAGRAVLRHSSPPADRTGLDAPRRGVGQTARHTGVMNRDRDASGRPRDARPRDGLGRPLPYGAPGVARPSESVVRTPEQTLRQAQHLLDAGRPFHADEVF